MSKKVIITGVNGQLGSYMAEHILSNTDFTVIGTIRRSSSPNHKNLERLRSFAEQKRFEVRCFDVTDKAAAANLINTERPDYFINFAGNSFLANSWNTPYSHMDTNFFAVIHQLEAIKSFASECRYFNAGSSEQFGLVDSNIQCESTEFRPRNPYGVSKASAQFSVESYSAKYNLYALQGILYNCESSRRSSDFLSKKIAQGVARIKKSIKKKEKFAPIEVGNLCAKRDWSHASDFVDGIWKSLNQESPSRFIFSSGKTHSVRQFIQESFLAADMDCAWQTWFNFEDETLENSSGILVRINKEFIRPDEDFTLKGDNSSARNLLGWEPKFDFKSMVRNLVEEEICQSKK